MLAFGRRSSSPEAVIVVRSLYESILLQSPPRPCLSTPTRCPPATARRPRSRSRTPGGPAVPPAPRRRRPASMRAFAARLAESYPARALAPVHPGFALTDRPEEAREHRRPCPPLRRPARTARPGRCHCRRELDRGVDRRRARPPPAALTQSAGPDRRRRNRRSRPSGEDVAGLPVPEIMKLSFHDPAPFLRDPSTLSAEEGAALAANQRALAVYAPTMTYPTRAVPTPKRS